jgi:hypothetical protein
VGGAAIHWFNKYGAERHLFISQALMEELRLGDRGCRRCEARFCLWAQADLVLRKYRQVLRCPRS